MIEVSNEALKREIDSALREEAFKKAYNEFRAKVAEEKLKERYYCLFKNVFDVLNFDNQVRTELLIDKYLVVRTDMYLKKAKINFSIVNQDITLEYERFSNKPVMLKSANENTFIEICNTVTNDKCVDLVASKVISAYKESRIAYGLAAAKKDYLEKMMSIYEKTGATDREYYANRLENGDLMEEAV